MYGSADVANIIRARAKYLNIQLKDMLSDLGMNKNGISSMLHGSMPKADTLAKIADYLNCSVDYLLGRTDVPQWEIKKAPPESGAEEYGQNINTNDISPEDIKELVKWIKSQKTKD